MNGPTVSQTKALCMKAGCPRQFTPGVRKRPDKALESYHGSFRALIGQTVRQSVFS